MSDRVFKVFYKNPDGVWLNLTVATGPDESASLAHSIMVFDKQVRLQPDRPCKLVEERVVQEILQSNFGEPVQAC